MVGYPTLARAEPNPGHRALAALGADGRLGALLTQNVDGLHQQAGSLGVIELHGNIHKVVCLDCHAAFPRAFVQGQLVDANPGMAGSAAPALPDGDAQLEPESLAHFQIPWCVHCGGMLKPDVVFFGDGVPAERTARALAQLDSADALLVVGSSLIVFSGYRFCRLAAQAGKPIAAVNLGKTRADDLLALKIEASAERVLPALLDQMN
jgi:NAD-dependent SIR2 family protein deacetylase